MEPPEYVRRQKSVRLLMSIFFIVVILSYAWLWEKIPFIAKWLPIALVVLGAPIFIGASIVVGRYRKVYDYEEASFLGRQMFAQRIRGILFTISLAGGWMCFGGAFLYVISLF